MSHKSAKKIRKLLQRTATPKTEGADVWNEREYTEDTSKRKKQKLQLELGGEEKVFDVSMGQVRLKPGSGRAMYKLVKKVMTSGQELPKGQRASAQPLNIREVDVESA